MAASDVLSELSKISSVLHLVSNLPGLSPLAIEANALDALIANPETVQRIYALVETGISGIEAIISFLRSNGLNDAVHFLTWGSKT